MINDLFPSLSELYAFFYLPLTVFSINAITFSIKNTVLT